MAPRVADWLPPANVETTTYLTPPHDDHHHNKKKITHKTPSYRHSYFHYGTAAVLLVVGLLVLQEESTLAEPLITGHSPPHSPTKLQRGQVLDSIKGQDLYQAYKEIQQDYHAQLLDNPHWKLLNDKDGVQVSLLQHPSDPNCPYVQMKAILPTSVQDCWDYLSLDRWDDTMQVMDPFYEGLDVLGEYNYQGIQMVLARKRTKRIFAFGKRDFSFVSVSDKPLEDGTWVSGTVSVITPQIPRSPIYTRAYQDSVAFYKPLSSHKTELTIVCRIDMNDRNSEGGGGGNLPMWLYVKTIGQTGARSVFAMKQHLLREVQERQLQQRQQQQHVREKTLHRAVLPWMEWSSSKRATSKVGPTKRRRRAVGWLGPDWTASSSSSSVLTPTKKVPKKKKRLVVTKSILWHRRLLPWMEWPPEEEEPELPPPRQRSLKEKLHRALLPWMQWPEEEPEDGVEKESPSETEVFQEEEELPQSLWSNG